MHNLIKRLETKGWSKKEIIGAVDIIKSAKQNKTKASIFLENRIYWILLVTIIAANFAIAVALIPILISLRGLLLYSVIVIIGIVFGLIFELVIRSIEHLEKKHHLFLVILIPFIALANIFVITEISNDLSNILSLQNIQNQIIIALLYSISFVLPYIVYRFILKIGYYVKE